MPTSKSVDAVSNLTPEAPDPAPPAPPVARTPSAEPAATVPARTPPIEQAAAPTVLIPAPFDPPTPTPTPTPPTPSPRPGEPGEIDRQPARPVPTTACPYPGLVPFDASTARWFFGRERAVADLTDRVRARLASGGPLVLVGASGSGKSSLLRAGLLPALAGGALPGSARWPRVVFTPGEHPLRELVRRIAEISRMPATAGALADAIRADPSRAVEIFAELLAAGTGSGARNGTTASATPRRFVIAVDQLEEIFTLCTDARERAAFVEALCVAAAPAGGGPAGGGEPVAVVAFAVRADFYARCAAIPLLAQVLQTGQVVVGAMAAAQVREAIVNPAAQAGVDVEPGLVELLLRDLGVGQDSSGVVADPGSLPLLAHALRATWFARDSTVMSVAAYQRVGGLTGAIAQTAEGVYTRFDAPAQAVARRVLTRMVRLGPDGQDTRRRVDREALLTEVAAGAGADEAADEAAAAAVLDALVAARLVEADAGSVQIAHEALLRSWPRLREWMDVDRAGAVALQQLTDSADAWQKAGRDPSYLLAGTRLAAAREWVERRISPGTLTPVARAFYDAGVTREDTERRAAARRARVLRQLVAGLTVGVLIAAGTTTFALVQRSSSAAARDRALSQRIANQAADVRTGNPSIAAQLSLVAYRTAKTPEARGNVLSSFNGGDGVVTRYIAQTKAIGALAYSPDSRLIATGSDDWTVAIWDAAHPARLTPLALIPAGVGASAREGGHTRAVKSVAFSRDGKVLATGGADREAKLWDIRDPSHPRLLANLPAATGDVYGLAFSPVSDLLAVGGYGNSAWIFDVRDPAHPVHLGSLFLHLAPVVSLAFSHDGQYLAAGDNGASCLVWTLANPRAPYPVKLLNQPADKREPGQLPGAVRAVAWASDDRTVYTAFGGRVLYFTGSGPTTLAYGGQAGHGGGALTSLSVQPGGDMVAAAGFRFFGVPLYQPKRTADGVGFQTQDLVNWTVAFSPDGREIANGSADGALRVHALPGSGLISGYGNDDTIAVNPRTGVLATLTDTAVELWDAHDTYHPVRLAAITDQLVNTDTDIDSNIAFSPDGRLLAISTVKHIVLYDVTDPRRPRRIGQVPGPAGGIEAVAFTGDERRLLLGGLGSPPEPRFQVPVQTWDISDPAAPRLLTSTVAHLTAVHGIEVSADGRTAASVGDRTVRLWDISDPARTMALGTITLPEGAVVASFSPDGRTLAVGGGNAVAAVWDIADLRHPRRLTTLPGHSSAVNSVQFSPDGKTLATGAGSGDNTVQLWNMADRSDPKLIERLKESSSSANGILEVVFSPDGKALAGAVDGVPAALWELDADAVARRVCATAGVGITREEWRRFLPDLAYDPPCG